MLACQLGQRRRDGLQVVLHQGEGIAHLQHGRGVRDVLGCGAPMRPLAQPAPAQGRELLHNGQHGVADVLRGVLQLGKIVLGHVAMPGNLVRRLLRDHPLAALGNGKRLLHVEVALDAGAVGPDGAHGLRAEDAAVDLRVDGGRVVVHDCSCWLHSSDPLPR